MEDMLLFLSGVLCVLACIVSTMGGSARIAGGIFTLFAALCAVPRLTAGDARTAFPAAGVFGIGIVVMLALWWMLLAPSAPARERGDDGPPRNRDARRPCRGRRKRWCG